MTEPKVIHHVVFGALVRDGRVLLCHRHPGRRYYPDVWDLPGGHIEPGEDPAAALRRELREELGIEAIESTPLDVPVVVPGALTECFVVRSWTGTPSNLAPDEHDDLRWVLPADLASLKLAVPEIGDLVREALEVASGEA